VAFKQLNIAMNYKKMHEEIASWKGVNKEYWVGVDILKRYNLLTPIELQKLNEGCDCVNEDFINAKFNQAKIDYPLPVEIIIEPIISNNEIKPSNRRYKRLDRFGTES